MKFFKELRKNLPYLAALFGTFALLLIFCPAISSKSEYGKGLRCSGLEVAFGSLKLSLQLSPSAMILTYLTLFGAIACTVLSIVLSKQETLFRLIAGGLFFTAMIFFFCSKAFMNVYTGGYGGFISRAEINEQYRELFRLGAGAVLSAFFCLLACVSILFNLVFDKAKVALQAAVTQEAEEKATAAETEADSEVVLTVEENSEEALPSDVE